MVKFQINSTYLIRDSDVPAAKAISFMVNCKSNVIFFIIGITGEWGGMERTTIVL